MDNIFIERLWRTVKYSLKPSVVAMNNGTIRRSAIPPLRADRSYLILRARFLLSQ